MTDAPDVPQFTRLDLDLVWRLGSDLVERCRRDALPVTISARLGRQRVFHAALPGTSADNDSWVDRKLRVVAHFGVPSLQVEELVARTGRDLHRDFGLDPARYAAAGGAVPLLVAGVLAGGLAVSGLASAEDHRLAVEALQRFCS